MLANEAGNLFFCKKSTSHNYHKQLLLIAVTASISMIFLDQSSIGVLLPSIHHDLSGSSLVLRWIVNIYLLTIAALVLIGGRLADYLGSRKTFLMGLAMFLCASILCALSHSMVSMLFGRFLQGLGASLLIPAGLVLINIFYPPRERGRALGRAVMVGAIFFSAGPFVGGFLSEYWSWQLMYLLNVPISLISAVCLFVAKNDSVVKKGWGHFDFFGAIIFIYSISALVISLMQLPLLGWSNPMEILLFVTAMAGFVVLAVVEKRKMEPLIKFALFMNNNYLAGNMVLFFIQACVISVIFWSIWLQNILGFSPLMAGFAVLPGFLPAAIISYSAGKWLDVRGARKPICLGLFFVIIGLLWIAFTAYTKNYPIIFFGMLSYGVGAAITIPNATTVVLNSVDSPLRGMAAGTLNTLRQAGGAIGIAVVGVVTSMTSSDQNVKLSMFLGAGWFPISMLVLALFGALGFFFAYRYLDK